MPGVDYESMLSDLSKFGASFVLVWCIRSSLGNTRVIDADPLLWFVQISGSLSTQKAPE